MNDKKARITNMVWIILALILLAFSAVNLHSIKKEAREDTVNCPDVVIRADSVGITPDTSAATLKRGFVK